MDEPQGSLKDLTTNFPIRIWNDDLQAFDRLQKRLRIPREHLGRLLWHLAITRSPEIVAADMREALALAEEPGVQTVPEPSSEPEKS